ncbi:two-component sensor histidine kinase [Pseudoxanthomonas broegbernensis]|uniref:histidine kinase n=1 Tax=Pseudoxanthomonas broegbernensis TaxID=83619 RepID=A0A7V8K6E4_9GAMM|nr:HAMP domain-containing sensor histidine kinase [Pseudoxanthomonas broegbernensis]KAF1685087.1 two-component sensor histidine kinase [Pseudoxanthomonas broegbernensis]MBB6066250.1 signal transduction histidine kinase [Pseudoxanthomonas broegbernensis]
MPLTMAADPRRVPRGRLLRTSSFRLTLLYAGLFVASLAVLLGVVYLEVRAYAVELQDEIVGRELHYLRRAARDGGPHALEALIEQRLQQPLMKSMRYLLQDRDGRVLAGNAPAQAPVEGRFWFHMPKGDKPHQQRRVRAHGLRLEDGRYLLVGEAGKATEEFAALQRALARDMGYALLAALALALGGGALMSHLLLRRVERIDRDTRAIMLGDLSRRRPVGAGGDEFDRLSASVNAMLERIQAQVDALRQVSDDIAHDLRTPLGRLRQQLERGQRLRDPDALHAVLERATTEVDAALRTFASLLHIAQIGSDPRQARRRPLDLSTLLETLAEVYQPAFEARGQSLTAAIAPGLEVDGDRDLLGQLFANLLENAGRHCPEGARIALDAAADGGGAWVTVADDGPGIPEAERERVFRRLYRLERSRTTPGSGLGLALVEAIARMHGARIALEENAPGLRVRVRLPGAAASPSARG